MEQSPTSGSGPQSHVTAKLFGRERLLHEVLGGGKFADVVMWRDKRLSAAVFIGGTLVWYAFEVMEYSLLTLSCHISITALLVVFISMHAAILMDWRPPVTIPLTWNRFIVVLHVRAIVGSLRLFLMVIGFLWILSVIGSCCSTLNLLYFGFLCIQTLPALYEHYEYEVDHRAAEGSQELEKLYKNLKSKVASKIPKGPAEEKED